MFFLWQRQHVTSRLPPERLNRAIISGARYALHSSPIRTVLIRAALFGLCSAATAALPVLMARDLLHGNARTFGILLCAPGVGAVLGALAVTKSRGSFGAGPGVGRASG